MGERGEVAGCANRAFLGDAWIYFGVDQLHQGVDDLEADAGIAPRQAVDFQDHHQPHRRFLHKSPDAGGMGEDNRSLEMFQFVVGNNGAGQQAEAGIDAVNYPPLSMTSLTVATDASIAARHLVVRLIFTGALAICRSWPRVSLPGSICISVIIVVVL